MIRIRRDFGLGAPLVGRGFHAILFVFLSFGFSSGNGDGAPPEKATRTIGFERFSSASTGIHFTNKVDLERSVTNSLRLNGAGVSAGDVDGDGWCDFYFCSVDGGNQLFRNLGNWKFEDITGQAGVACAGQHSAGCLMADVDGDGDLDLLVSSYGKGVRLFLNDGKGRFRDSEDSGLLRQFGSTSLAMADVDGNGTLDLYVANYATTTLADHPKTRFRIEVLGGKEAVTSVNGMPTTTPELEGRYWVDPASKTLRENGEADFLYLNSGEGKFQAVSWTNGLFRDENGQVLKEKAHDWGLSVMFRDLNGDRAPDFYVCNDFFSPDRIWINDGKGGFQAIKNTALRCTSMSTMGIDFADINRDGFDDFVAVDMLSPEHQRRMTQVVGPKPVASVVGSLNSRPQVKRNTLFLGRGDGDYAEAAQFYGVEASEWSWTPIFIDVDLDGYEDLLVTTGHARDSLNGDVDAEINRRKAGQNLTESQLRNLAKLYPLLKVSNKAYRNVRGERFEEVGREWGFAAVGISHGMCLADLDNDGDLDVVVNNQNEEAGLYRNESSAPRVSVRLKGLAPNTRGIGARIKLLGGAVPEQCQEMICGGRYLSGDDAMRVFAAGSLTNAMRLEVVWRSGKKSVVENVTANQVYELEERHAVEWKAQTRPEIEPLFEDTSQALRHVHRQEAHDDWARQALLPRKLSQLGPGLGWLDVDQDGQEDLVVGRGRGGEMGVYLNQGAAKFGRLPTSQLIGKRPEEQTGIAGWDGTMVAGWGHAEQNLAGGAAQRIDLWAGGLEIMENLPILEGSAGPVCLGDFNLDGKLDLFVGSRVTPGKYPEAGKSRVYLSQNGKWILSQELDAGMVSGGVVTDLDGDGQPDLVLACEWGPVRVFRNEGGHFKEATTEWGLEKEIGWWTGISAGDFDGDGRMDLVVGNWGRNSKYESKRKDGLTLNYGDLDGDGRFELVEGYYDAERKAILPWRSRDYLTLGLRWLPERYTTHAEYGKATVAEILEGRQSKELRAWRLESMLYLNRGGRMEGKTLPIEAQLSPVFGVSVGDLDGDGAEDVVLSQNFFGVDEETSRYDGGRGVLLKGDGQGEFQSVGSEQTGLRVYGEGRGTALCDFDGDGRADLVVAQNGAETKLYRNRGGRVGLKVRLRGPEGNPNAVGAVIRLMHGEKPGPAREVHAGSGYWSQDSAVQIMGKKSTATAVEVRWPGGKITTTPIGIKVKGVKISLFDGANRN